MSNLAISKVIQKFLPIATRKYSLSGHQRSILNMISLCKTSALGSHREQCNRCDYRRIHYNSCGNRNCPSCQGVNKEKWIIDRQHDLLPVKYFHCVFTIPSQLYVYFRYNKRLLYGLMMRCVKECLMEFGLDPRQAISGKIGGIMLLHTWTQQMTYHPHVHCIVPAGGINNKGEWKHSKKNGEFLFPVKALSALFRGKLLHALEQLHRTHQLKLPQNVAHCHVATRKKLYKTNWVVYAKKAFGGPEQVLEYLGRYTHKICISNYRILKVTDSHVVFKYTDRTINKTRTKTIKGEDFIRLFAEHILPKRFIKVRHFGFLSSRSKKHDLAVARRSLNASSPPEKIKLTTQEFILLTTGKDPNTCPKCEIGEMVITHIMPPIRGSPFNIYQRPIPSYRKVKLV